jgi:hypothetical protein
VVSREKLEEALRARLDGATAAWLDEGLADAARGGAGEAFARRWSAAGRRLGKAPLDVAGAGTAAPSGARVNCCADEAGRALLLASALAATPSAAQPALVEELFHKGEVRERQAVLKALPLLPGPDRFVEVAVEAVRSNMLSVLEAIACENPYPAAHLPELLFNQMIMKLLFNGIPLGRVVGLEGRRGAELARVVASWVSERRAAGRPVPDDALSLLER